MIWHHLSLRVNLLHVGGPRLAEDMTSLWEKPSWPAGLTNGMTTRPMAVGLTVVLWGWYGRVVQMRLGWAGLGWAVQIALSALYMQGPARRDRDP